MLWCDTSKVHRKNIAKYKLVIRKNIVEYMLVVLMLNITKANKSISAAMVWMDYAQEELLIEDDLLGEQEIGRGMLIENT